LLILLLETLYLILQSADKFRLGLVEVLELLSLDSQFSLSLTLNLLQLLLELLETLSLLLILASEIAFLSLFSCDSLVEDARRLFLLGFDALFVG
jgi:hypothetical protein